MLSNWTETIDVKEAWTMSNLPIYYLHERLLYGNALKYIYLGALQLSLLGNFK